MYELYYLDLATGLRRGELLGLKWTDVDLDRGVLKIQRAISRQNGKVVEAPLKTKNAYRTLPLSADAISVLRKAEMQSREQRMGIPLAHRRPHVAGQRAAHAPAGAETGGLPRIRFHDLRHTFATMALQNGVDVKTVSSMLGHYSAGFTLDTYAHVTTDAQLKAAQTMGNILSRASDAFRYPLPLGSAFGSEKSSTLKTELMKSKSPRNQTISRTFGTP